MLVRIATSRSAVIALAPEILLKRLHARAGRYFRCNVCGQSDTPDHLWGHLVDDVVVPRCTTHVEIDDLDINDRLDYVLRRQIKRLALQDPRIRHARRMDQQRKDADVRRRINRAMAA
jgi:hypothetical protein